jgi:SAM-dependent methyltransferase
MDTGFMVLRRMGTSLIGGKGAQWLRELNERHAWSHNDYFHSWILANLPDRRGRALDMGCGRGGLVRVLASHFEHVVGADADAEMRRIAEATSAAVDNVSITDRQLDSWADDSIDLVTMVAVLHHLDIDDALRHVGRILAPGGRVLIVGLAPPRSVRDLLWDSVSIVTNPLIGFIHRPWPSPVTAPPPPFPVKDPVLSFDEIGHMVERRLPGAVMRHRIGFRHTIEWTKPRSSS